jgi:hypothetical protein
MHYKQPPVPLLPVHALCAQPDFRAKILSKPELVRLENVLFAHEELFANAPMSPAKAQHEFFHCDYGPHPPNSSARPQDFVRWCKAIVAAAQLNENWEWEMQEAVAANIARELPLITELFEQRIPAALTDLVGSAGQSAETFRTLMNISDAELLRRLNATLANFKEQVERAKASGDWLNMLYEIGISI